MSKKKNNKRSSGGLNPNYLTKMGARNLIAKADQETNILITVMGSADANTGTMKRNQHLSEARGKYVFDILTTKYGISPERLTIKAEVVKDAAKPSLSRAVVISF